MCARGGDRIERDDGGHTLALLAHAVGDGRRRLGVAEGGAGVGAVAEGRSGRSASNVAAAAAFGSAVDCARRRNRGGPCRRIRMRASSAAASATCWRRLLGANVIFQKLDMPAGDRLRMCQGGRGNNAKERAWEQCEGEGVGTMRRRGRGTLVISPSTNNAKGKTWDIGDWPKYKQCQGEDVGHW